MMMDESRNTDEISTPSKVLERNLKEQHRSVFNLNAFGIDNDGNIIDASKLPKTESKGLTKDTWLEVVRILSTWKDCHDLKSCSNDAVKEYTEYKQAHLDDWRKDKKLFYHWKSVYAFEVGQLKNGVIVKHVVRIEKGKENMERRLVIPISDIFDIIYDSHSSLGHMGE